MRKSLEETAGGLGSDGDAYRRLFEPLVAGWPDLVAELLRPIAHVPRHPLVLTRFGRTGVRAAFAVGTRRFPKESTRALFAGAAAHSLLPLERRGTSAFGLLLLALAHAVGWPLPRGGSQAIADALAKSLLAAGGEIETGREVTSLRELPKSRAVLCDVTPRQLLALAGDVLRQRYRRRLERWRYGPGVFKLDYALDGPIPWRAEEVAEAGTVHLGGSAEEIAASESAAWHGRRCDKPFVLVAQQSLFDETRAPRGKHTAWAYCHVPNGSTADLTGTVERQIERFAPGFRDLVLARSAGGPAELERDNANLVGGDIAGGANVLGQLVRRVPYTTPLPWLFVCSASTPPGAGVHGMCGHLAAKSALRRRLSS